MSPRLFDATRCAPALACAKGIDRLMRRGESSSPMQRLIVATQSLG